MCKILLYPFNRINNPCTYTSVRTMAAVNILLTIVNFYIPTPSGRERSRAGDLRYGRPTSFGGFLFRAEKFQKE